MSYVYHWKQELSSFWRGRLFGHNRHGLKSGGPLCPFLRGDWSLSNTMSPGTRPTSVPSGILIHPAVWPQLTGPKSWGCYMPLSVEELVPI